MVLLSQLIRTAAITGRSDNLAECFVGRQGGRWAEQTVRAAVPTAAAHGPATVPAPRRADADETRRELTDLHQRGVINDEEFEALRRRLSV
jgi:Short C-terminal domain